MEISITINRKAGSLVNANDRQKKFANRLGTNPNVLSDRVELKGIRDRIDIKTKQQIEKELMRIKYFKQHIGGIVYIKHSGLSMSDIDGDNQLSCEINARSPKDFSNKVCNYIILCMRKHRNGYRKMSRANTLSLIK